MISTCIDCGRDFHRDVEWKVRCLPCWRLTRPAKARTPSGSDELTEHLRDLLQLCHPDRHGGSPLANRITQWLLEKKRNRVGRA